MNLFYNKNGFTKIEAIVSVLITFTAIFLIWSFVGLFNSCSELEKQTAQKGLKGVLTEFWEGPKQP